MHMEMKRRLRAAILRAELLVVGSAVGVMAWTAFAPQPAHSSDQHTFVQPAGEATSTAAKIPTTLTMQSADEVELPGAGDENSTSPTTQAPPEQATVPAPAETSPTPVETTPSPTETSTQQTAEPSPGETVYEDLNNLGGPVAIPHATANRPSAPATSITSPEVPDAEAR